MECFVLSEWLSDSDGAELKPRVRDYEVQRQEKLLNATKSVDN
jgi:hypothetical protein